MASRTPSAHLLDVPKQLVTKVVFDQSVFVRNAIENLIHEGAIGLVLTGVMILVFLGSMRATVAVFLSIPLSALAAFIALSLGDSTINAMILGGLALAFSRLIDNSVVVLENIFRHLEMGETPEVAAERGGKEVALPVLAATLTTVVVFFPVTFLYGVSRFLFTALALAVVLSLFASYFVAMTVVPLFCAKLIKGHHGRRTRMSHGKPQRLGPAVSTPGSTASSHRMLDRYEGVLNLALLRPLATVLGITGLFLFSLALYPLIGEAYFPRTDPGQFVINLKAPTGTRLELTDQLVEKVEAHRARSRAGQGLENHRLQHRRHAGLLLDLHAQLRPAHRLCAGGLAGRTPRSAASNTWTACASGCRRELPQVAAYFQTGGLVDAILNLGMPAPLDIQVSGMDIEAGASRPRCEIAQQVARAAGRQRRAGAAGRGLSRRCSWTLTACAPASWA